MDILITIALSILSLVLVFAITKIFGNKQVSQMNLFDYVMGITLGSIAAELATELEVPTQPIVAMIVYGAMGFLITVLTNKSIRLRKWISGTPAILMENNIIYKEKLKKSHIDINEFLTMARQEGYYDVSEIDIAILEHTGKISFLPKPQYRPVTGDDLKIPVQKENRFLNIIEDGAIMQKDLEALKKDKDWLAATLHENGYSNESEVFLMTLDKEDNYHIYPMRPGK